MANWKKIIVSGSNAHLAQITSSVLTDGNIVMAGAGGALQDSNISLSGGVLNVGSNSITSTGANSVLSGSFSGSFQGDGSSLTGVIAAIPNSLLLDDAGSGLAGGTFSGQTAITASLDLDNLTATTVDVSADSIAIIDATDGGTKKESIVNLVSGMAGSGLTATSGQLGLTVDSIQIGTTDIALGATGSTIADLTLTDVKASGSFTGSFFGNFVGTTDLPDLTQGSGIVPFTYDGSGTATVAVSGAAALSSDAVTKWNGAAFVNSSLTDNGTVVSGASSIQLSGASSILSGSFSGSFQGDGSQLTGIATNLDVSGSDGSGISIDLKTQDLTIGGTANEIETTVAGTTVTIGLPDDVTIGQDLIVSRNLTVFGTASFQHSTNLDIADRFILMASGSNTTGDGGIVVQQGTQGVGETFAYDAATTRWGVTGSFDATQNAFTPEAFMATVIEGGAGQTSGDVVAKLAKKGNIFIQDNEDIWIFS